MDINTRPEDYPDHSTWLAELLQEAHANGLALRQVPSGNPLELDRRCAVLNSFCEANDLPYHAAVDVDTIAVEHI